MLSENLNTPAHMPPVAAPGPPGSPVLGNLLASRRMDRLQYFAQAWQQYGDVMRLQMGPLPFHLLIRPEHVHHVLVKHVDNYPKGQGYNKLRLFLGQGLFTSEGPLWKRQRRLMQPPFTPRGVQQFATDMLRAINKTAERWQQVAESGQIIDVNEEMMRLAMNIIGRTMFGFDVGAEAKEAAKAFTLMLRFVGERSMSIIDIPLAIPTPQNRRVLKARETVNHFMDEIIAQRRQQAGERQDLLSILLNARDEETGASMDADQLRHEVLTIFFAGHETTAQALTWAWYLLSIHPLVTRKLHAELDNVLGGRLPTVADLPNLPYTCMVIEETLRLYPPVWGYVRDAKDEDVLDGYVIPAGSMVLVCPYLTHRHPEFWANPEAFDPERFTPERVAARPKYAYFPFGGGQRVCLGEKFAMLEAQLVLATLAQRFYPTLQPAFRPVPEAVASLRPRDGMPMRIQLRRAASTDASKN